VLYDSHRCGSRHRIGGRREAARKQAARELWGLLWRLLIGSVVVEGVNQAPRKYDFGFASTSTRLHRARGPAFCRCAFITVPGGATDGRRTVFDGASDTQPRAQGRLGKFTC